MKLYGAIDLHSNNNVTVLIDEQDQVVYQMGDPHLTAFDPLRRSCGALWCSLLHGDSILEATRTFYVNRKMC